MIGVGINLSLIYFLNFKIYLKRRVKFQANNRNQNRDLSLKESTILKADNEQVFQIKKSIFWKYFHKTVKNHFKISKKVYEPEFDCSVLTLILN